jgi:hypothetical protein
MKKRAAAWTYKSLMGYYDYIQAIRMKFSNSGWQFYSNKEKQGFDKLQSTCNQAFENIKRVKTTVEQ